jgi:hypothetical protein
MDRDTPKTRRELKGRDKEKGSYGPYSQKHVRLQEALRDKQAAKGGAAGNKGSPPSQKQ